MPLAGEFFWHGAFQVSCSWHQQLHGEPTGKSAGPCSGLLRSTVITDFFYFNITDSVSLAVHAGGRPDLTNFSGAASSEYLVAGHVSYIESLQAGLPVPVLACYVLR